MTAYAPTYGPPADPTSVVGRRIGAWFIDLLIYLVLVVAAVVALGTFEAETIAVSGESAGENYCRQWNEDNNGFCGYSGDDEVVTVAFDEAFFYGASLLNLVGLIVIQGVTGGSLGKLAVGLRVIDEKGQKTGIGKSAIRTLLWVVDGIVCGPVLGGVLMVSTKGHRRVGDMAAGTYVVDKNQLGHPVATPGATTSWPGAPGSHAPVGGYGQAPGWGQAPGSWQPPAGGQQPPAGDQQQAGFSGGFPTSPPTQPAAAPSADGPTWDAARDAYIQYDRDQSAWLQWDDASQQWKPIDS